MAGAASKKRTYLFQLTDDERATPTKKVKFTEKLPQLEKDSDDIRMEDARNARLGLQTIVDGLWRNPKLCVPAATWLQNRLQAEQKPRGDGFFSTPPTMLKFLDQEYLAQFLVSNSRVTLPVLEAVSVFDPDSPLQLLSLALGCNVHLKLPECLMDEELMGLTLRRLMEVRGHRLKSVTDSQLTKGGGGGINWSEIGVYAFEFNENMLATSVLHRPSKERALVPEHCPIHSSFKLTKNWSDYEAVASKKPSSITLHTLFEEQVGPHKRKVVTGSSEALAEAVAFAKERQQAVKAELAAATTSPGKGTFKQDHRMQQQHENVRKARAALTQRKKDLESKRIVSLTNVAKKRA